MNVRLPATIVSLALLVSSAAYAQSAPPAQNQSESERVEDNWTGFHVGASVGHLSQTLSESAVLAPFVGSDGTVFQPGTTLGPASAGRVAVGVFAGYDTRLMGRVVGGIEVQVTGRSPVLSGLGNGVLDEDVRSFHGGVSTSARARVGAAITKGLLVYGLVGAVTSRVTGAGSLGGVTASPASARFSGMTFGIGGEYEPWKHGTLAHLSVGAELRRAPSERKGFPLVSLYIPVPTPGTLAFHANELDVRVSYRFSIRAK